MLKNYFTAMFNHFVPFFCGIWKKSQRSPYYYYYYQLFFVFMSFSVMAGISYFFISQIIQQQMEKNCRDELDKAKYQVQGILSEFETALTSIANSATYFINKNESTEEIRTLVADATAAVAARDTGDGISVVTGLFGEIRGQQLDGQDWLVPDTYNVKERDWYKGAVEQKGKIFYSKPYISMQTNKPVITISKQLFDNLNQPCGVLGIDFDLFKLSDFMKTLLQDLSHGYVLLLDSDLTVVTHIEPKLIGKHISETSAGGSYIAKQISENKKFDYRIPHRSYGDFQAIYLRSTIKNNGWQVIAVTPIASYHKQVNRAASILFAVGISMGVILSLFLTQLYREKANADSRNKSKTSFLAKMSHEIRTPMNVIMGLSRLILKEKNALPPKILKYVLEIRRSADNLLAIINDILDLSKAESGSQETIKVDFILSSLLEDVISIIRSKTNEKALQFQVFVDPNLPNNLCGDVAHLRQILLNILNNSVKYTLEGYLSLEVSESKSDGSTVFFTFVCKDTGIGIKKEDLNQVFLDFVQVDSRFNWNIEGTGLGLHIVKELVQKLNGEISLQSTYGQGSQFTVVIPVQCGTVYEPLAKVLNPETHNVLVYEPRTIYEQSLTSTFRSLDIQYKKVNSIPELIGVLKEDQMSYSSLFINGSCYKEEQKILDNLLPAGLQVILLCEQIEQFQITHIRSIVLPLYSRTVADILNNIYNDFGEQSDYNRCIKAPEAKILVVEDNRSNILVIEGLLEPYECSVDVATNGLEAVNLVKQRCYDLIFMDHMMTEMDGIEATRHIRALPGQDKQDKYFSSVPIIALTANAVIGMKELFIKNGMNDFISKPIDPGKLNEIMVKWLPSDKKVFISKKNWNSAQELEAISIQGVNTQLGIIQTGGTIKGYISVVRVVYEEIKQKIDAMQYALDTGDLKLYKNYVHSYKGSLATIGTLPLSAQAAVLEHAAAKPDRLTIDFRHPVFVQDLQRLGESISDFLRTTTPYEEKSETVVKTLPQLRADLMQLKTAIAEMKVKTIDSILDEVLSLHWDKEITSYLEKISQHIMLFEWQDAAELIDTAIRAIAEK
jgi:signal transduction histidine kinase/CheY-like chemotaxis protein